jgi:hypothetical protein
VDRGEPPLSHQGGERAKARVKELIEAGIQGTENALTLAGTKLKEAQAALAEGKLGTARTAYQAAVEAVGKAREPLRAQAVQMGKAADADADAPNSGPDVPASIIVEAIASLWPLPLGRDVTLAEVRSRLRKYNFFFAVAMLVLAVLSGLQLLYFPNPTFGYGDLVVAFLWGRRPVSTKCGLRPCARHAALISVELHHRHRSSAYGTYWRFGTACL